MTDANVGIIQFKKSKKGIFGNYDNTKWSFAKEFNMLLHGSFNVTFAAQNSRHLL